MKAVPLEDADRESVSSIWGNSKSEQRKRDSPLRIARHRARHVVAVEAKFRLGLPTDLACDFGTWQRRVGSIGEPHPASSRAQKLPLAVVMHVYYPDLVPLLLDKLSVIDVPFDLFVTNASGQKLDLSSAGAVTITVLEVENRGRDVWPFMQVVQSGALDGYGAVVKLHTKKSPEHVSAFLGAADGREWRENLVNSLLGSAGAFRRAFAAVTEGKGGLACHQASIAGPEAWGTDRRAVRHLARRIGVKCPPSKLRFPAGSIFIMRGSLVPVLKGLRMSREDFEGEDSGWHTTTAHALERLMGYVAASEGLETVGLEAPEPDGQVG